MHRPPGWALPFLILLLLAWAAPAGAVERDSPDPYVLLDQAKQVLADGKMDQARRLLEKIPLPENEPVVAEEIVLSRLLLSGSFLTSAATLKDALVKINQGDSAYARWLGTQVEKYGRDFQSQVDDYIARFTLAPELDYVQFSVPLVSDEYLQDVQLMTDPQVVSAAVKNWDEGRQGLGEGLVASQARIAFALACAAHYDLADPSTTLEAVARRLRDGVPLDQAAVMDWVADTALHFGSVDLQKQLVARADAWIMELTDGDKGNSFRKRAEEREQPKLKSEPEPAKKGKNSTPRRKGTSRKP